MAGFNLDPSVIIMSSAKLIYGSIKIGKDTFIGDEVMITGGDIKIGKNCDIAPRVSIHAGTHIIGSQERRAGMDISKSIVIEDGCWIGAGSIIIAEVSIGSGSIVAAGSVVKKGIYPPNSFLAGNPAKVIKTLPETT